MIGRVWTWRRTPTGGRWLGWSPAGVVILVVLLSVVPILWWFGPLALLGLMALVTWDRVSVDTAGVTRVRGLGPIPWAWRRFPPGGKFVVYELLDGADEPREVAYRIDDQEHVLLTCSDPERVRLLLEQAAGGDANQPTRSVRR